MADLSEQATGPRKADGPACRSNENGGPLFQKQREPEGSVTQRATVLAGIGAAGQRTLVPIDPDRLAAAERADHAGGLVADLLETFDDLGRHAVLELVEALVVQAARHIDGFLHVAAIVEDIGQHMALADRLIL